MKRIVFVFLTLGLIVPLVLISVHQALLLADPYSDSVLYFRGTWYYVWPTAVWLMAAAGASGAETAVILGIAIAGNILLYGLIGLILGASWRRVSRTRGRSN
jgi:hypothetical protein